MKTLATISGKFYIETELVSVINVAQHFANLMDRDSGEYMNNTVAHSFEWGKKSRP